MCGGMAQALVELRRVDVGELPAERVGSDILELLRLQAVLDSEISRRIADFDRRRGYEASGSLDTVSWLRFHGHLFGGAAADRVKVARAAEALPQVTAAIRAGDISHSHAAVIARAADALGSELVRELEPILVEAAAQTDPGSLRVFVRQQAGARRSETLLEEAQRLHEARQCRLNRGENGLYFFDAQLDPEGGAIAEAAFNAVMGPRRREDRRTETQRRADAFADICRRFLDGGSKGPGTVRSMRPHIIIVARLNTLLDLEGAPPGRLGNGEPLPYESLMRNLCDSVVSVVALDADGSPLAASREARTIPPSVRRAILARTSTCEVRGCSRPAEWCDGHHFVPVAEGTKTSSKTVVDVCTPHHHMWHEDGWRFTRAVDSKLELLPPSVPKGADPGS